MAIEFGLDDGQQGVAQERQRSDDVGCATASFVLQPASVTPPVISVFASGPVPSHQLQPTPRGPLIHQLAGHMYWGSDLKTSYSACVAEAELVGIGAWRDR